jgi:hypothetical protein
MITHPEKVLFPDDGITKAELAAYYESVAAIMVPHICGRPVTLERYPAGIGGKGFWQKDVSRGFPEWLERVEVPKKDGTVHHPLINDMRSLLWMATEHDHAHVWVSRVPALYYPDVCVLDLDPLRADEPHAGRGARAAGSPRRARPSELEKHRIRLSASSFLSIALRPATSPLRAQPCCARRARSGYLTVQQGRPWRAFSSTGRNG